MSDFWLIRTSDQGWSKKLYVAYRDNIEFKLFDDAGLGIDLTTDFLCDAYDKGRLTPKDWANIFLGTGSTLAGAWLLRIAMMSPEPVSKLPLVGVAMLMMVVGAPYAMYIISGKKPMSFRVSEHGIEFGWD